MKTARDLGPPAVTICSAPARPDAYAAVVAVPVIAASDAAAVEKTREIQDRPATTEVDATRPR